MRNIMIVLAVYAIPAVALLTFAFVMEKWIEKELKKPSRR
jgi:hypothetical protein